MSADGRLRFAVEFDRISRNHDVAPLEVTVDDGPAGAVADLIAQRIYDYARPKVGSRELEVSISYGDGHDPAPATSADLDGATGVLIVGGFRPAGRFTIRTFDGLLADVRERLIELGGEAA